MFGPLFDSSPRRKQEPLRKRLSIESLEDRNLLAVFTVNTDGENQTITPVQDTTLTLREAISYVNGDFAPLGDAPLQIDLTEPIGIKDRIIFDFDPDPNVDGFTLDPTDGIRKAKIKLQHEGQHGDSALDLNKAVDANNTDDRSVTIDGGDGREVEISVEDLTSQGITATNCSQMRAA